MSEANNTSTRRGFLVGLLAGVGAVAVMGGGAKEAAASAEKDGKHDPILFRKTEETARYYRTLD
ncbi:MAG: hypothetical protein V3V56_01930 [bacterium]